MYDYAPASLNVREKQIDGLFDPMMASTSNEAEPSKQDGDPGVGGDNEADADANSKT